MHNVVYCCEKINVLKITIKHQYNPVGITDVLRPIFFFFFLKAVSIWQKHTWQNYINYMIEFSDSHSDILGP